MKKKWKSSIVVTHHKIYWKNNRKIYTIFKIIILSRKMIILMCNNQLKLKKENKVQIESRVILQTAQVY